MRFLSDFPFDSRNLSSPLLIDACYCPQKKGGISILLMIAMVGRMPVVSRERLRLREILQGCQYESGVSQWIKKLKDVYESSEDPAAFFSDLTHYLSFALTKEERSKYVNRVLEVVCQFGASFLSPPSSKEKESGKEGGSDEEGDNDDEEDESGEELPLFLSQLFHWLLDHHAMEGLMARLRVCLMLNRLLKLMGENATILEDLFQKIYDNMQERLQDRVAAIRGQAVTALQRLQDPSDTACPIIKAFVFHLCADPSPLVRKAVIQCIAVTKSTLAHVIRRTKDFDDSVRLATYKTISAKVHVRSMTIAQREDVLKRGLKDTSPQVREVVKKDIIQAWLRHSKEDILKLLYVLDVENSNEPELADATLDAIFEGVPNAQLLQKFSFFEDGGGRLIPVEKISLEIVVYWRNLLKKFHADGDEDHVELIVPELSVFCKYVRSFVMESMKDMDHHEVEEEDKMGTQVLILKQFILMMKFFDLSDEAGRGNLGHLLKDMLLSSKVSVILVPQIIEVLEKVNPNAQTRVTDIAEIIAEIREPMKDDADDIFDKSGEDMEIVDTSGNLTEEERKNKKMAIGKLHLEMNELRDELDRFIEERDFVKAQEIKTRMDDLDKSIKEIQEELSRDALPTPVVVSKSPVQPPEGEDGIGSTPKGDDPILIHKCLEMIHCLLKDVHITALNPTLRTLLDEFILPNVKNINFAIRQSAVGALGLAGLRSLEDAKKYVVLLLRVAVMDMVCVRVTSISVINDFLMAHGLAAFNGEDENASLLLLDVESFADPNGTRFGKTDSIVSFLIKLLDDQDVEVRTKVVESLCKLQIFGSISSSKLFMRLMLTWFNPLTDNDGKMCHILGKFFPLYASLSRANQEVISEAVFPTLECLWSAPVTSPLTRINIEDVLSFFVRLTKDETLQNHSEILPDSNIHDSMAETISNAIIDDSEPEKMRFLTKALTTLQLSPTNFTHLRELKVLHSRMTSILSSDKVSLKNLDRYGLNLDTWLSKDDLQQPSAGHKSNTEETEDEETEGAPEAEPSEMTLNTTAYQKKRTLLSQELSLYVNGNSSEEMESEK